MVNGDFIFKMVERAKFVCYRCDWGASHTVALYLRGNI